MISLLSTDDLAAARLLTARHGMLDASELNELGRLYAAAKGQDPARLRGLGCGSCIARMLKDLKRIVDADTR